MFNTNPVISAFSDSKGNITVKMTTAAKFVERVLVSSELEFGDSFGQQQIRYIPIINIYIDTEKTKLWNGEFRTKP